MDKYHKIYGPYKRDNKTHKVKQFHWTRSVFGCLADANWTWTEKVDGTNIRVMFTDGAIKFGGRTDRAQLPPLLLERLGERFTDPYALPDGTCLYGEGYGPKIQKGGGNYRADQDFVLFDVNISGQWVNREMVEGIAKGNGLDIVPIVGSGSLYQAMDLVEEYQKSTWGDFQAEGVICKPAVEVMTSRGRRVICKIKARDYYHG